jgi:hypothetical protein
VTGERSNTVIHIVVLKKYNYTGQIFSGRKYIPHSQSRLNFPFVCTFHIVNPRNMFSLVCTFHTVNPRSTFPFVYTSHIVTPRKTFPFAGTSHTIFHIKSFVIALPLHTILTILSFALLNASHTVRIRNCLAKAVHHTHFLCGKRLRKVA